MKEEMLTFIKENRVGVLAVQMLDGTPHASTVHFAHSEDPLSFIILTEKNYRKCEAILEEGSVPASFVVGTSEDVMKTLQLDGVIEETNSKEAEDIYFEKFSDKRELYSPPEDMLLKFIPSWWRFTDWTKPEGKTTLDSSGKTSVL